MTIVKITSPRALVTLQGGEDRVEEVQVGLLSCQRGLISVRDSMAQ